MQRPDPMIASKPGAEDVEAMENRVKWLAELYVYDGRDKRDHPMHGIYTGLAQKYQQFTS
tara:strand:+ start:1426 stop:1605 length:180 start_codon:yes stop_codon:yes gene_type:complete